MEDEQFAGEQDEVGMAGEEMPDAGSPGPDLPEGVQKEVVKEAPDDEWKHPKTGDEVTVHYVGTLQAEGTEFDSSRSRGQPFTFILGKGEVIKGWDLGVATMRRGEVAKFTFSPEFAYGQAGSPPKVPPDATLVFEVELLNWSSRDDLFQDGGVIKTTVRTGIGYQKPLEGKEVRLTLRVLAAGGDAANGVLEEHVGVEYKMGTEAFGPLSRVVDKALLDMKKQEEVRLVCSKEYAFGEERPDGVVVELTLEQIYDTSDVSFASDGSLVKKQLLDVDSWDTPSDGSKVTVKVEAAVDGTGAALPNFTASTLEFTAGQGEVCDALECVVVDMKKGERALLTCTRPQLCVEDQLGLGKIEAERVVLTLELVDFSKPPDFWEMPEGERLVYAADRKDVGAALFRRGRYNLALGRYKRVMELFEFTDDEFKDKEQKDKAKELRKLCELNVAACQLKLGNFSEAKAACNGVLKEDSSNVKALFRRAQADLGLRNFEECIRDLRRVIDVDAQNREARKLLRDALAGQKEDAAKVKGLFAKMCAGLGHDPKRPAAETAVAKPEVEDAEMADSAAASGDAQPDKHDATAEAAAATEVESGAAAA